MLKSIVFVLSLAVLAGCSGAASSGDADVESESTDTPSWCAPLNDVGKGVHVDPIVACEEFYGTQPNTAYACQGPATSATSCPGFASSNVSGGGGGVVVYCCTSVTN